MYLKILGIKHNTVDEKVLQFKYFSLSQYGLSWDHFWTKLSDIMDAASDC